MNDYVIINGVNSNTISGLKISKLPPITKPQMRTLIETIDGRDGDLITDLGYSAYDKQLEIGLWGTYDINEIISFFNQSGTITFSNEADKFYNFKIINQIDYQKLLKFKTAVVVMHCQPFKYPTNETPIEGTPTTITGEGESLTLNNTLEAPLEIDLKGNTYQYSTTGKNKLSPIANASASDNGITLTNNNGVYKLYGSTPSSSGSNITRSLSSNYTIQSGDYLHIGNSVANSSVSIGLLNSGTQIAAPSFSEVNRIVNLSDKAGQTINQLRIYTTSSQSVNMELKPMICNSSGTTEFEYFTGGQPAPSPDYPQDIQVVSGDNTINVNGRNLLDTNKMVTFQGPVASRWWWIDGKNAASYTTEVYYQVQAGQSYTFSIHSKANADKVQGLYNINGVESQAFIIEGSNTSATFTPNTTTNVYIRLHIIEANTDTYCIGQLEKGSTATEFQPTTSYPIYLGVENLFDGELELGMYNGETGQKSSDNSIYRCANKISVKPSTTYTFSINGVSQKYVVLFYDKDNQYISQNTSLTTGTFTTLSNAYYIAFRCFGSDFTSDYANLKVQLEKGSKANHYTPYGTTPIELCKIGDYRDYIYKDSGKWYLHKEIGKVVLNGTQNISLISSSPRRFYTTFENLGITNIKDGTSNMDTSQYRKNDHFIYSSSSDTWGNYWLYNGYLTIYDSGTVIANTTVLNEWLNSNNTTIYYVLETPTDTPLEDLIGE